jgi:hypothetical protein
MMQLILAVQVAVVGNDDVQLLSATDQVMAELLEF